MDTLLFHIIAAILWIIIGTSRLKLHPLICLMSASIWVGLAAGLGFIETLEEFTKGFGTLIGQIGLIIILGSIMGVLLEKSNAALVLAKMIWHYLGKKIPALSTTFMGYVVGIPVFCDSGFILLNPIGKNLARTSGKSPLTFSLSLAGGLYLSHLLIPPTPGPLAVAGILHLEQHLGLILIVGFLISIPVFILIAWWANRFKDKFPAQMNKPEEKVQVEGKSPSPLWPVCIIVLPLLLITLGNLTRFIENEAVANILRVLGNPIIAISLGLLLGFLFLRDSHTDKSLLSFSFKQGIEIAGPIMIVTGAGAGFGAILRQSGLEAFFQHWDITDGSGGIIWLLLAFALTAFLKTAQGSSTSAMIIAASIVLSVVPEIFHQDELYMVLLMSSIGAGAMAVSHANDSYFWIIKEFTGLTVKEALNSLTVLSAMMGVVTLLSILLLYWIGV